MLWANGAYSYHLRPWSAQHTTKDGGLRIKGPTDSFAWLSSPAGLTSAVVSVWAMSGIEMPHNEGLQGSIMPQRGEAATPFPVGSY